MSSKNVKSIPLIKVENNQLIIQDDALKIIERLGDTEVVVYSINGPQKKGKSFMLNCILTHLNFENFNGNYKDNYIHGFESSREETNTLGINIWPQPHILELEDRKIALILLDLQGCFESQSIFFESACLSTMSLLISSIYIHNVQTELINNNYALIRLIVKLASSTYLPNCETESEINKRFSRHLFFLKRDEYNGKIGFREGYPTAEQNFNLASLNKENIREKENQIFINACCRSFKEIDTYYLPFPGQNFVKNGVKYGSDEFFLEIKKFLDIILGRKMLIKKKVDHSMTGSDLAKHITECLKFCEDTIIRKIPESRNKTVHEMRDEIRLMIFCDAIKDFYKRRLELLVKEKPLDPETLKNENQLILLEAFSLFDAICNVDESRGYYKYRRLLEDEINSSFNNFKHSNQNEYNMLDAKKKIYNNNERIKDIDKILKDENLDLSYRKSLDDEKSDLRIKNTEYENKLKAEEEEYERLLYEQKCVIARKLTSNFLYRMESNPLGICLILNIFETKDLWINNDTTKWRKVFSELNFNIKVEYVHQGKISFLAFLENFKNSIREENDSLVIIITSHGSENELSLANNETVRISEILDVFSNKNCPNLINKPKIIFINSCRLGQYNIYTNY
jgi:hypothetical protein